MRGEAGERETRVANRGWWDSHAREYQAEHGDFLGDARFLWGPEGLDEADAGLLGEVAGLRVLEVGCGAGQCARWLAGRGALVAGIDLSEQQLRIGRRIDERSGVALPTAAADACRLPFADSSFDLAFSSYGAVPFVADSGRLMAEAARVIRPGGRWVFSTAHPIRWCFPDDPGPGGLVARDSYWDRTPYVEMDEPWPADGEDPPDARDAGGALTYAEHHRTVGDRVREIVAAGLVLTDLVEPEWPADHDRTWGGWSRLRGRVFPGTAIFVCTRS